MRRQGEKEYLLAGNYQRLHEAFGTGLYTNHAKTLEDLLFRIVRMKENQVTWLNDMAWFGAGIVL